MPHTQIVTAKEIASAMCYLHGCNILHGDLTSNNILLTGGEKDQRMFVSKVCGSGVCVRVCVCVCVCVHAYA